MKANLSFEVGAEYKAMLNGQERTFEILEFDGELYGIRWDDGDEEWAYPKDMERWIREYNEL
jgi:hypothetical protein